MSDLISRSAFIKVLKDRATNEAIAGYMTAYDVTNSIIDEVEEQPTAYDIDKVVEELKKESEFLKQCNYDYEGEFVPLIDAIEIVKQGGVGTETETIRDKAIKWNNNSSKRVPYEFIDFVEGKREIDVSDDVCEWKVKSNYYVTKCSHDTDVMYGLKQDFKYCPYCSKKIKVVE